MSLICWCGSLLLAAMCQHALLAFFGVQPVLMLVAICVKTTFGVAAVPAASDGRHFEHKATYETGPRVNTAEESHEPFGAFGGSKTSTHFVVSNTDCDGSNVLLFGPPVDSSTLPAAAI